MDPREKKGVDHPPPFVYGIIDLAHRRVKSIATVAIDSLEGRISIDGPERENGGRSPPAFCVRDHRFVAQES